MEVERRKRGMLQWEKNQKGFVEIMLFLLYFCQHTHAYISKDKLLQGLHSTSLSRFQEEVKRIESLEQFFLKNNDILGKVNEDVYRILEQ